MKKTQRPESTVRFTLANGVKIRVDAYARLIRNSDRVDAKIIGIDWETITTNVCLDLPGHVELLTACLDDHDALFYMEKDAMFVAVALGSEDYAKTIENAIYQARANVLAQKGA